jgi:8-oxo-dGTP pyrophosphatase MutT (NUDIX family)
LLVPLLYSVRHLERKTLLIHQIFQHQWITICENERGMPFVRLGDGVMIVPMTPEGEVLLITEPSAAYDEDILLLPAGGVDSGESPSEAANRELQEEIGYRAGRLEYLGTIYPAVKYLNARLDVYLGRDLQPSQLAGDETWTITLQPVRLIDFENLISDGRLRDSSVIASLYMAQKFLQKEREKE